jgi:hypothetical protein
MMLKMIVPHLEPCVLLVVKDIDGNNPTVIISVLPRVGTASSGGNNIVVHAMLIVRCTTGHLVFA